MGSNSIGSSGSNNQSIRNQKKATGFDIKRNSSDSSAAGTGYSALMALTKESGNNRRFNPSGQSNL